MGYPLIIANWKLNQTQAEIKLWLEDFVSRVRLGDPIEVAVAAPFPYLFMLREVKGLQLAAQDVSRFEHASSHTGEVSARQLADLGVEYVIVGHSERRRDFGETNEDVVLKVFRSVSWGLTPVVCVSNLEEVEALDAGLKGKGLASRCVVVAYEPLEAIGSGKPADLGEVQRMALAIKGVLGENRRVLYGGSVDADNVLKYAGLAGVDGVLVGTASLKASNFIQIIKALVSK